MRESGKTLVVFVAAVCILGAPGCSESPSSSTGANPIVGTWLVKDPNAPFPYHLYVFNADGTMQQANPDAGDPHASDSDGKGIWIAEGDHVKGKWVEVIADRVTHRFTGRLEISFDIKVAGDTYAGTETARFYDVNDVMTEGPATPVPLAGKRVKFP